MHPFPTTRLARRALPAVVVAASAACADRPGAVEPEPACGSGPLALDVGESVLLPAATEQCVELVGAGAGYALAYADGRWVERARTQPEHKSTAGDFTVAVTSAAAEGAAQVAPPPRAARRTRGAGRPVAPPPSVHAASAADCPFAQADNVHCRATPWQEGERFTFVSPIHQFPNGNPEVEVALVRDPLVFVVADGEFRPSRQQLGLVADSTLAVVFPLLGRALTPTSPVTSTGAGQVAVLLTAGIGGTAYRANLQGGVLGFVGMPLTVPSLATIGHEMAHLWHMQYLYDTRPGGVGLTGVPAYWAEEGAARFAEHEVMRRALGLPLDANACRPLRYGPLTAYLNKVRTVEGTIDRGYQNAASFLHHLMVRSVQAGVSEDDAYREVMRGAIDGPYGLDALGLPAREGLVARMRRIHGASWEPVEALLDWAASHALDDRTTSPRFQNPTICRAWDSDGVLGWETSGTLTMGAAGSAMVERPATTAGYFMVEPGSARGALALSTSAPGVRWMLVRYR